MPLRTLFPTALPLLLITCLLFATGCGGGDVDTDATGDQITGTVQVDGSSTVYPITEAVAEEFMREHPEARASVGVSGTGGGFSRFLRGETDINNASRTISQGEIEQARQNNIAFIEMPIAYDGLAVITNNANDFVDCLTVEELRAIWAPGSEVNNWNQVRSSFPDKPLALYGPGTDSGTYDYFTEAIMGESGASRSDFTASEDDNVLVQGIEGDQNALGFFGLAYYENNQDRLRLLGVDGGEGCVQPTAETVNTGEYAPLSRPLFIYVRGEAAERQTVQAFVNFYLDHVADFVGEIGYVALAEQEYALAQQRFDNRTTGTMYGGEAEPAMTLTERLRQYGSGGAAPTDTTTAPADTVATTRP